jgi:hypothetical protein
MGGTIGLVSAPGQGARFTVVVPVRLLEGTAAAAPRAVPSMGAVATAATASLLRARASALTARPSAAGSDAAVAPSSPSHPAASSPAGSPTARSSPTARATLFPSKDGRRPRVLLVDDHQLNLVRPATASPWRFVITLPSVVR